MKLNQLERKMNVNDALRFIAGLFVLASVALAYFVSSYWLWLTVFVAVNLMQSAFSKWCPMMSFLRMAGVKD
jgi:hypothetical protein